MSLPQEIIHAARIAPILHQQRGVTITRVYRDIVLKYGPDIHLSEARNMRVMNSTDMRLPTVFDAWEVKDDSEEIVYLLMQYIDGDVLDKKWPGLDIYAREDIHSQLNEFLRQLHTIRLSTPGSLGGDLYRDSLFIDYNAGLFRSQKDLKS